MESVNNEDYLLSLILSPPPFPFILSSLKMHPFPYLSNKP